MRKRKKTSIIAALWKIWGELFLLGGLLALLVAKIVLKFDYDRLITAAGVFVTLSSTVASVIKALRQ